MSLLKNIVTGILAVWMILAVVISILLISALVGMGVYKYTESDELSILGVIITIFTCIGAVVGALTE